MPQRKPASDKTIVDYFLALCAVVLLSFAIMIVAKMSAEAQAQEAIVTIAPTGYWLVVPAEMSPDGRRLVCTGRDESIVVNCVPAANHLTLTTEAEPA